MTCRELHRYFEDYSSMNIGVEAFPAGLVGHANSCSTCRQFVEARTELGANLRLLRNSSPPISASLDGAVLANYRSYVAELHPVPPKASATGKRELARFAKSAPARKQVNLLAAFGWTAALAAAMIVTRLQLSLFFPSEDTIASKAQSHTVPLLKAPQITNNGYEGTMVPAKAELARPRVPSHRAGRKKPDHSLTEQASVPPVGFRSLMYCDQLSCAGAMQIVRVQLSSSAEFMPASMRTNQVVLADVLVGPDGIARGIRIVE